MTHRIDSARPGYERAERAVLVTILTVVGALAGLASFTHVHDWTMDNSPEGTPDWFGWTNASISELIPVAALLAIRHRRRHGGNVHYPMALLTAAAALSLAAQLAVAKPGPSGWLLSAVPSLAFMALSKLVLSGKVKPTTSKAIDAKPQPEIDAKPQPEIDAKPQPEIDAKPAPATPIAVEPAAVTPAPPQHDADAKPSDAATRTAPKSAATASKIQEIAGKMPAATPAEIAAEAGVSESTARRYLPAKQPAVASKPQAPVNGVKPDLDNNVVGALR